MEAAGQAEFRRRHGPSAIGVVCSQCHAEAVTRYTARLDPLRWICGDCAARQHPGDFAGAYASPRIWRFDCGCFAWRDHLDLAGERWATAPSVYHVAVRP